MIFAQEKIIEIKDEVEPILRRHYEEIAWNREKIPLDIDWDRYLQMDESGVLVTYTARIDGVLVGYSAYVVMRHPHYKSTIFAQNDVLYIDKPYRGKQGKQFIQWCEDRLKERGAHVHGLHIKKWFDWSPLALRMGFAHMDGIYMKWIGN